MSRFIPCCAASDMVLVAIMMSALVAGYGGDRLFDGDDKQCYLLMVAALYTYHGKNLIAGQDFYGANAVCTSFPAVSASSLVTSCHHLAINGHQIVGCVLTSQ